MIKEMMWNSSLQQVALKIILIYLWLFTRNLMSDCPRLCECKWKSGKESVICLNANLSSVPLHLDAGTQIIDLTGNNIMTIKHDEFSEAGLLNLQKVYISKCRLKNLDRYAFRNLINLVELDLSYNILSTVPSHIFDSIPELRELKLSGNPIQRITNGAFINLPRLVRLELSDCKIGTIESRAFNGLQHSLEWLKLDKNKLIQLQSSSITILRNLHGIDLEGNPWNCSCTLRPLREWMLRKNVPFGVPPVCQYPKRLTSKSWDKLDLDEFACTPEIFAYDSKAHGVEGKNVTMTCRITGIPEPHVRWLSKNRVIANLSGGAPYSNGKKLYIVHLQNNASDLTILAADIQDAGVYICAAENKAGRAEASVTLAVSKKPPEGTINTKLLFVSVITGTLFVLASCLVAVCFFTVRKKQVLRWRRRDCHVDNDNYEKIELNHKVCGNNTNGGTNQGNISVVGGFRNKNGEYRVVPGADTDQELDDDDDNDLLNKNQKETKFITPATAANINENKWNSPDHQLLDANDLHIPRRTIAETRDDFQTNPTSTSGTYNPVTTYQSSTSSMPLNMQKSYHHYHQHHHQHNLQVHGRKPTAVLDTNNKNGALYTSTLSSDLSSSYGDSDFERKYPDLLELNSKNTATTAKANSEGGSLNDISEIFCTLPRKRGLNNSRYISTDSQFPLLQESRYNSSGGESINGTDNPDSSTSRRLSDSQKYTLYNLNKNKLNQRSNSYLNLTTTSCKRESSVPPSPIRELDTSNSTPITSTTTSTLPLLDFSTLENRSYNYRRQISPITSGATSNNANNTYDYHAAQLERFLEEYRNLQKQLTKMKETCDNLRQDKYYDTLQNNPIATTSTTTPIDDSANMTNNIILRKSPNILQETSPNSNQTICYQNYDNNDLNRYHQVTTPTSNKNQYNLN